MLLKRTLLGIFAALVTLVLVAGVYSLATGSSLRRLPGFADLLPSLAAEAPVAPVAPLRLPAPPTATEAPDNGGPDACAAVTGDAMAADAARMLRAPATDAERHSSTGPNTGIYRMHEDPRVRYVLKSDTELSIVDSHAHTNRLGMRVRPGPPAPPDALRIAVVGDSVAFGYGVEDDQTVAAQLEALLAGVRGPAARPIACHTVAVPSWNHRSALAFLTDHWNEVHANIVVYLPIPNDLGDAGAIYESGKLRLEADAFQADPLLLVSRSLLGAMETFFNSRSGASPPGDETLGPVALEADLTPESIRRYDDNAAGIVRMARLLASRGARLLVVHCDQTDYTWHLDARLQQLDPDLPVLYLERYLPAEFTLGVDPHPNAETCAVRANWIAADLLRRGWVDRGADAPLPGVPDANLKLLGPAHPPQEVRAFSTRAHTVQREALLDEIDFTTGKGLRQVIGGLNVDLTLRMHGLFVLRANGPRVALDLVPLPQRADLYPLQVAVELAGVPAGIVTVEAGKPAHAELALPESVKPGQPFEVKLLPPTWCVDDDHGSSLVASLRPVRLACIAP